MAKHRPATRARRFLLPILMISTLVLFLAPAARANSGLSIGTDTPADLSSVSPGDTILYSFTVTNAGPDPATAVELSDAPPANTTYVTNTAQIGGVDVPGDENPGDPNPFVAGVVFVSPVAVSGTVTFTFSATVNSPLANGTQLVNTASAVDNDDTDMPVTSQVTQTVTSAPALAIDKTASPAEGGTVDPGDTISYTIVVRSVGSDTATSVTVSDPLDTDTTYVPNSAELDGTNLGAAAYPFTSNYALGDMAGSPTGGPAPLHTLTFDVVVNTPLPDNTPIDNTATAGATNVTGTVSNDADHTVDSIPGLTINKTSSPAEGGPVNPGATIAYTIVVTNDALATATATGISVTDATPANTTYVASSTKLDGVAVVDNVAAPLNPLQDGQALPDMDPGDTHTFTFDVTVDRPLDNGTSITNTATLSHNQGPNMTNDAVLTVQSAPKLTVVKTSAPAEAGKVTPGTTIAYTITITNASDATEKAKLLKLLDPTPANTTYVANSAKIGTSAISGSENPFSTAYTLPDLLPTASHTVTFSVLVSSPLAKGTVISNLAKLTSQNHADLQDGATHTVDSAPVLKLGAAAIPTPGTKLEENDTITYSIGVANDPAATESLNGVLVSAPTPEGTSFVEGSAKLDGTTINSPDLDSRLAAADTGLAAPGPFPGGLSLGTMAPGSSHTLTYRVRVKPTADQITNTITVTATNQAATVTTLSHRGPNSGDGGSGGSGSGGSGSGGSGSGGGTTSGGGVTSGGESLAFTGLDLARLLLLAMTLLLAGWTLLARGRAVQRRLATGRTDNDPPSTGSATVDRWVDSWFYPQK